MSEQHLTPVLGGVTGLPEGFGHVPGPKVVVGFDDSEHAIRALSMAAQEADRRGAELEILCGWPWEPEMSPAAAEDPDALDRARRHLEEAADRVRAAFARVPVTPTLTADPASEVLLRHGGQAALTVVGTRGHGGFVGLLLGSVSLRLAAHTTSPLLVVGEDHVPGLGEQRGRVVVGMKSDGRAPSFLAMTGYEQVRSVVAALDGDLEAAGRVDLVLPETGVCNGAAAFDDPNNPDDPDDMAVIGGNCCGAPTAVEPQLITLGRPSS